MEQLDYEYFKRYVRNQLSGEERQVFEERLETDKAFARQVHSFALLYESILVAGEAELDEQLRQLGRQLLQREQERPEQPVTQLSGKRSPKFPRYLLAIAAAVLALAVLLPLLLLNRAPAGPEELYAEHFSLPPLPEARGDDAAPVTIAPWREAYLAGEYGKAIAELNKLLADENYRYRSEAHLYLGLSHLALEEPQAALAAFEQVSPDSFYIEEAGWYRALTHLKLKETEKARELLAEIAAKGNHPRRGEAAEILAQL